MRARNETYRTRHGYGKSALQHWRSANLLSVPASVLPIHGGLVSRRNVGGMGSFDFQRDRRPGLRASVGPNRTQNLSKVSVTPEVAKSNGELILTKCVKACA